MTIAQGINKQIAVKKQTGLGVPASGSGGFLLRRETAVFNLEKQTYSNNEIVSHQQSTGVTHGLRSTALAINGVLSPNTYSTQLASLLRRDFTAGTSVSALSVTITGSGPTYTITRGSGSYLTDGIKIGDVVRLSVGTLNAANINKNLLVVALTALVATVVTLNGSALVAEGPIASTTMTVQGKKTFAPTSGHTQDYWTFEEWYSDITRSSLYSDVMIGAADIGLPSSGNATIAMTYAGLQAVFAGSRVLTTPTAETTTPVLSAVNGVMTANGSKVGLITGATLKIDGKTANIGGVVGSNISPDLQRGRIEVSGQMTVFFQDGVFQSYFDAATVISATIVVADSGLAASDFVSFTIPALKFSQANIDDGEKGLVLTMPFTAQINSTGGAGTAYDQTILSIQDTLA
jgi:hypothetical protein